MILFVQEDKKCARRELFPPLLSLQRQKKDKREVNFEKSPIHYSITEFILAIVIKIY